MRSTNLVIFLVFLNFAAIIIGATVPVDVSIAAGGGAEIDQASADVENRDVNQPSADEITGSFLGGAGLIQNIATILFAGPNMLVNLGMPSIFRTAFMTVLTFVISFDVYEAVSGRPMS
jgi:hypothetical protein